MQLRSCMHTPSHKHTAMCLCSCNEEGGCVVHRVIHDLSSEAHMCMCQTAIASMLCAAPGART